MLTILPFIHISCNSILIPQEITHKEKYYIETQKDRELRVNNKMIAETVGSFNTSTFQTKAGNRDD